MARRWPMQPNAQRKCPVCGRKFGSVTRAVECWLYHEPDLAKRLTLQKMGDAFGVTRECVRLALNRLHVRDRSRPRSGRGARGTPREGAPRTGNGFAPGQWVWDGKPIELRPGERRPPGMTREQDPRRKLRRALRFEERLRTDPKFAEQVAAKYRRKEARRKERLRLQRSGEVQP